MWLTFDEHVRRVTRTSPWTPVVGLARSLLAAATAITLLANRPDELFPLDPGLDGGTCDLLTAANLFCVVGPNGGRAIGVAVMAAVVVGYFPRWTCVPHWYVAHSLMVSISPLEGGDQLAAILTLLLLPNLLADGRRNHWRRETAVRSRGRTYLAHSSVAMTRVQVCVVYLHAAIGKLAAPEWADGTATFYWFGDPVFGVPSWASGIVSTLTRSEFGVASLTWGTILVEIALACGIVAGRRSRRALLVLGVALHGSIAVLLGLVSFGITMVGALILYLVHDEDLMKIRRRAEHLIPWTSRGSRVIAAGSGTAIPGALP